MTTELKPFLEADRLLDELARKRLEVVYGSRVVRAGFKDAEPALDETIKEVNELCAKLKDLIGVDSWL